MLTIDKEVKNPPLRANKLSMIRKERKSMPKSEEVQDSICYEIAGHCLQNKFMSKLCEENIPVSIYLKSGIKLRGVIGGFDNYTILLKEPKIQLIFKEAISTIIPEPNKE